MDDPDVRLCKCHGEPMDRDRSSRGGWRCAVKRRETQLRYWHRTNGGYVTRRRRMLNTQREQILERLTELNQERASC